MRHAGKHPTLAMKLFIRTMDHGPAALPEPEAVATVAAVVAVVSSAVAPAVVSPAVVAAGT